MFSGFSDKNTPTEGQEDLKLVWKDLLTVTSIKLIEILELSNKNLK